MRLLLCAGLLLPCAHALALPKPTPPQHRTHRGDSRFFLDTADVVEWARLLPLGIFHGVTTNPVLLQRAGVACTIASCQELAQQAFELGAGEVMLQAWGETSEAMVASGLALCAADAERIVIKVPVTAAGTQAASVLISRGVRVCLTACYGSHQALVAVSVGAEYLAPYLGRMDDAGKNGHEEIEEMQSVVEGLGGSTRIFAASIRHVDSLTRLAEAGVYTFTFSPDVARMLFELEPLTDRASAEFNQAALALIPPGWEHFDPARAVDVERDGGLDRLEGERGLVETLDGEIDGEIGEIGGEIGGEIARLPPTDEELTPGHPAMIARAAIAKYYHSERVLAPPDALKLIEQVRSTGAEAEIIDVERRTALADEQGATIIIEGAHSVSLDSLVEGGAYMPDAETAIVLTCDRGPKALVALDFLYDRFEQVYCIDGGTEAWQSAELPTEPVQAR